MESRISDSQRKPSSWITRWSRRLFLTLLGLLVFFSFAGAIYQAIASHLDRESIRPRGEMVDIGSHRLHLHCEGAGSPTVVLDAGAQFWSSSWQRVQEKLSRTTRVCAHDRSGFGFSEAGPGPYDGRQAADELQRLLEAARVQRPFVYVGHSLGTLLAQIYQERFPDELAGMVFVDWRPPAKLIEDLGAERDQEIEACGMRCFWISLAARLGVVRLFLETNDFLDSGDFPAEAVAEFKAISSRPEGLLTALAVGRYVPGYLFEALDAGKLGDLPLLVVYSSEMGSLLGQFDSEEERAAWFDGELIAEQEEALGLSTQSRGPIAIEGANHLTIITSEEYAARVAEEIAGFVEELQAPAPDAEEPGDRPAT